MAIVAPAAAHSIRRSSIIRCTLCATLIGALRLDAADHAVADRRQLVAPRPPARRRRLTHRAPECFDLVGFEPARVALAEVHAHREMQAELELAVAVRCEVPADRRARQGLHPALTSFNAARRAWRALVRRAFTVPSVTPSENAISS